MMPARLPDFAAPSVAVETSEDAAESIRPKIRPAHRVVLAMLYAAGPLSALDIQARTAWSGYYTRPRLRELKLEQLIETCDGKEGRPLIKHPTPRGRQAFAYAITALGRARVQTAERAK